MTADAKRYAAFYLLAISFAAVFFFKAPEWLPFSGNGPDGAVRAAPATPPAPAGPGSGNGGAKAVPDNRVAFPGFPVDINTAGRGELMMLPGIGEKTADRIIEKRLEKGGFGSTEELLEVKGIGPVKYGRLQGLITAGKGAKIQKARPPGG